MGQVLATLRSLVSRNAADSSSLSIRSSASSRSKQSSAAVPEQPKVYSWSNRKTVNPDDYKFEGLEGATVHKPPGSISGQQFLIEKCRNSTIFLLDWTESVTVTDCIGCTVFIGPCKGSFFLRHCVDCTILVLCQQFRTRDCRRISAYLCCCTQPVIENTIGIGFSCLQINYEKFKDQMKAANLSPFDNQWSNIHDFTPAAEEPGSVLRSNYSVNHEPGSTESLGLDETQYNNELPFSLNFSPERSLIPFTDDRQAASSNEQDVLVLIQESDAVDSNAQKFAMHLRSQCPSLLLRRTKSVKLTAADLNRIFSPKTPYKIEFQAPVVLLSVCGQASKKTCEEISRSILPGVFTIVALREEVSAQMDSLWDLADMSMN